MKRPQIIEDVRNGASPGIDALVHALSGALPLLRELARTRQDPEWHAEGDVHVHTGMVLDELYEDLAADPASGSERVCMVLGALLHDIAKPTTTVDMVVRGVTRIAAPRHEPLGRNMLGTALFGMGLPWHEVDAVMAFVGYHHEPKLLVTKDRGAGDHLRLARAVDPALLHRVVRADMAGRICRDKQTQLDIVELYRLFTEEHASRGWDEAWRVAFRDVGEKDEACDLALGDAIRAREAGRVASVEAAAHFRYGRSGDVPELVITVAPSGSGKSTWVTRTLVPRGFEVISLDEIRESLRGDREDQTVNGQVRQIAKERLKAALREKRKVVWDATSLRIDFRAQLADLASDYGALVTIVVFPRSEDVMRTRNRSRKHAVPESVLTRQLESWEWPERHEAHRMLVIDERGDALSFTGSARDVLPWGLRPAAHS